MYQCRNFPLVTAPSFDDKAIEINLVISKDYIRELLNVGKRTAIYQLWVHVAGQLPPVKYAEGLTKGEIKVAPGTLMDSVACFRGVQRPVNEEANGDSVFIYVLNSDVSVAEEPTLACPVKAVKLLSRFCLTVQVKETEPLQVGGVAVAGCVQKIECVFGDGIDPCLPRGFSTRYKEQIW